MRRYAAISDIHGNRWALEAVLRDIENRGIGYIINLGDSLYGPLDPSTTAEMLMQRSIPSVLGNEDRLISKPGDPDISPILRYVLDSLSTEQVKWLQKMPATRIINDTLFACHATPRSDSEYFFWDFHRGNLVPRSREDMSLMTKSIEHPALLCGHDHVAGSVTLDSGLFVANPGSVGLPAYVDDIPYPHVMQNGSPHARYAIISEDHGEWNAEHVLLDYDWEAAAIKAAQNGRQDWASWLRTGKIGAD
ncbi:MAG: metallophosphoesterase family protein [candidate division WOR-3 bacterium]|nr:MAG: metallophosphoesterase family protein [candidate division WOR-3 bacterium]